LKTGKKRVVHGRGTLDEIGRPRSRNQKNILRMGRKKLEVRWVLGGGEDFAWNRGETAREVINFTGSGSTLSLPLLGQSRLTVHPFLLFGLIWKRKSPNGPRREKKQKRVIVG